MNLIKLNLIKLNLIKLNLIKLNLIKFFFRKIEDDIDLKLYNQAIKDHKENPQDISFDEMMAELGIGKFTAEVEPYEKK